MKNKTIKITPGFLSKLVNEEVSKYSKKVKLSEAFGPYDATGADDDKSTGMHSWNFEAAAKELMLNALQPVVEEFINQVARIAYEANPNDEDDEPMQMLVNEYADDLETELLAVIEKYIKQAVEETAGFLSMKKFSLKEVRSVIRESIIAELALSSAIFNQTQESQLYSGNVAKSIADLQRFYTSALLNKLLISNKDSYNSETREFDDDKYKELEAQAEAASEKAIAQINQSLTAGWNSISKKDQ